PHRWVNMNALRVLSLVVAVANAQLVPGLLPYNHNFLHSTAFRAVGAPYQYTVAAPQQVQYTVAAPQQLQYAVAAPAQYTVPTPAPAAPLTFAAPSPVAYTTAAVAPAFVAPTTRTSQYHSQDELGQYTFGYSGGPSSRAENRDAFGVVRGSYNYVDANGEIQTQSYIADALGFRVAATNLPVAPEAGDAPTLVGTEPVMDTVEVKAAKASFRKLFDEAAAAAEAAPDTRRKRSTDLVAPESVQDTAEVAQAKAEFQALYNQAAAAAEAAPDVGPLEGPFHHTAYYAGPSYAPFRYNGLTPYTGLPVNYGALPFNHGALPYTTGAYNPYTTGAYNPYTTGALTYPHHAYPYNFAFTT
ncbi:unnamed protein product, partial [Meganyctiphanes norvegica]